MTGVMNAIAHASPSPLRGPKLDNRRVLAGVVDLVIVALGAAVVLFAGDALSAGEIKGALGVVILGWALYYFFALESGDGQTVGKMVMKLRTVGPGGGNPTVEEAARRNIFNAIGLLGLIPVVGWISGLVSLVAVIMIAVNINSDPVNRQGWHDRFAGGTRVLKIG